ncbi:protein FAR-RED IMPAIRED RESPONSE 1-like [Chenopodium quinoa]|uniref:protein FAR-RED IMPAIRED RESPONSE 1-like n=1 Tax=Chenopodium quinoa TaxID=63459 RepID=UPI000B775FF7|nr:protein FAR-RED IMPAIRED RESPONSE 1-like [Chenopodium quinoa]
MRAIRDAKKRAKAMDVSGSGGVVGGRVCVDELNKCKRKSKKCECPAKVYASLNRDGEWEIKKVHLGHTHNPTPRKAKLVKEYRIKSITSKVKRRLIDFFEEGVPISQIHGCFATEVKGLDNLQFTIKDLSHVVYKERRLKMVGGDAAALMSYFRKMQQGATTIFFHSERLDPEGRLKDVIWVDGRSRAAYEEFGDVVCFDATYLTNEYELPFVNFVGVNHHGKTILLGCALVSHENCDTFRWIFEKWLLCMNNQAPGAILTDQAAAIRKPLEEVMPLTRHRWCIWHIMRKIPDKLGKCQRYKDFKGVLKATEKRHMWVPPFMRDYFWARMNTTQRVESINIFFDGYVNRKTKLFEFPLKYAKAMDKRVRDETAADANRAKYSEEVLTSRRRYMTATFIKVTKEVDYQCHKFVTNGIMCNHMMQILEHNRVIDIPDIYVVSRWRKDIFRKHTRVGVSYHDPNKSAAVKRYNKLMAEFEELCDEAAMVNDDAIDIARNAMSDLN